jgi:hypothetical protein
MKVWDYLGIAFSIFMIAVVFPAGCETKRDLETRDRYYLESIARLKGHRP